METKLGYSVPEACAAVPCGKSKLYELIAAGHLEARKLGKKVIITTTSLRAYHDALPRADIRYPSAVRRLAAQKQTAV